MLLVVGLGNPGEQYARNRHNAGFAVVSELARRLDAPAWRDKFHGRFARCAVGDADVHLLLPMTFMNDSGRSVRAAASFFRVPVGDLVVVHDELDLPFGAIRLKVGGGHAGHNGLRSIVQELGTADFVRLRVGIGRPPRGWTGEVADFVLSDMPPAERAELPQVVERAAKSLVDVVRRGVPHVMNALNRRPKPPRAEAPVASDGRDGGAAPAAAGPAFRKEPGEAGAEAKEDVANGRERR